MPACSGTYSDGTYTVSFATTQTAAVAAAQAWACGGDGTVIDQVVYAGGYFGFRWTCPAYGSGNNTFVDEAGVNCTNGDQEGGGGGDPVPSNPNGYGALGQCYASGVDASQALCKGAYPVSSNSGTSSVVTSCTGVGTGGELLLSRVVDGGTPTAVTVTPAYGDCNPSAEFVQLAEVFGLFLAAIAVVYVVRNVALRYVLPQ